MTVLYVIVKGTEYPLCTLTRDGVSGLADYTIPGTLNLTGWRLLDQPRTIERLLYFLRCTDIAPQRCKVSCVKYRACCDILEY